jgi:hypothetical protein
VLRTNCCTSYELVPISLESFRSAYQLPAKWDCSCFSASLLTSSFRDCIVAPLLPSGRLTTLYASIAAARKPAWPQAIP